MTRWAMVADLRRCVGCQTCTAACKHANATPPGVQWRRVIDMEFGEYPDVKRAFVPVGCQHCDEPPCLEVCPSTATKKRADGIVTIDYDLCIGCAYCAVACPYQARYKTERASFAYGRPTENETLRHDEARLAVATKCTFCVERIDAGLEQGLTPGVDPAATPACVNSCIAQALAFGDADDPDSNVSQLLAHHQHFRMHEELGTGPGFHYIWDAEESASFGPNPWQQTSWDWRAAGNFMGGGAGCGLLLFTAVSGVQGSLRQAAIVLALALVSLGLLCVWAEIGRPWRAVNVMFNPRSSWMSREAALAPLLLGSGALWLVGAAWAAVPAALLALGFLYCQARILQAAKGIPAWREPLTVPLLVATGLAEGAGLFWLLAPWWGQGTTILWAAFGVLLAIRFMLGVSWYARLSRQLRPRPLLAVNQAGHAFNAGSLLPMAIVLGLLMLPPAPGWTLAVQVLAGVLAALGGAAFKFMLITRAGFNQGFALTHLPVRGVRS